MIEFRGNGETFEGYLAEPASGQGPGVVLIQEWWGLVGHIKNVADRMAEAGFTVLAPDMYQGRVAEEPDTAGKLMMALQIDRVEKQLRSAVESLLAQPSTTGDKVGVVGFCMGGQLAMLAATLNPAVGACANFYGIHPNVKPDFSKLSGPMLGLFAEHDSFANAEAVRSLDEELTRLGKPHEFHTYPGVHHAFFNDDRPEVYNDSAAQDAWAKLLTFFRRNLAG